MGSAHDRRHPTRACRVRLRAPTARGVYARVWHYDDRRHDHRQHGQCAMRPRPAAPPRRVAMGATCSRARCPTPRPTCGAVDDQRSPTRAPPPRLCAPRLDPPPRHARPRCAGLNERRYGACTLGGMTISGASLAGNKAARAGIFNNGGVGILSGPVTAMQRSKRFVNVPAACHSQAAPTFLSATAPWRTTSPLRRAAVSSTVLAVHRRAAPFSAPTWCGAADSRPSTMAASVSSCLHLGAANDRSRRTCDEDIWPAPCCINCGALAAIQPCRAPRSAATLSGTPTAR